MLTMCLVCLLMVLLSAIGCWGHAAFPDSGDWCPTVALVLIILVAVIYVAEQAFEHQYSGPPVSQGLLRPAPN